MSEYRFWSSRLRTGEILADSLPLRVSSFSRALGGVGELSASLDLRATAARNTDYMSALEPRRTVLWVSQDGFPVWAGVVWDWPHTSVLDWTLPVRALTLESLLDRREVRADLTFTAADVFDVARGLVAAATTGAGREVAGLNVDGGLSGVARTVTLLGTDAKKVLQALRDVAADGDFEWTLEPGTDGDTAGLYLRLGCPRLGQPDAGDAGTVLRFPGNVVDYSWPRTGSAGVNSLAVTATSPAADGTQVTWRSTAVDSEDVGYGYPVVEETVQYSGAVVGGQAQVDTYAASLLAERRLTATVPSVKVAGPNAPLLRELVLGSYVWLLASSPLHPADPTTGAPGLQRPVRVVGWTATPPADGQEESVELVLGEAE